MWNFLKLLLCTIFSALILALAYGDHHFLSTTSAQKGNSLYSRTYTSPDSNCSSRDKRIINRAILNLFRVSQRAITGVTAGRRESYPRELFEEIFRDDRQRSRAPVLDRFRAVMYEATSSWVSPTTSSLQVRGWINIFCEHYGDDRRQCGDDRSFLVIDATEQSAAVSHTSVLLVLTLGTYGGPANWFQDFPSLTSQSFAFYFSQAPANR